MTDPVVKVHELKAWPEPFRAMQSGLKTFEFRRDDRGYAAGDMLYLWEWDPHTETRTDSDPILRVVTYVLHGGRFGVPEGYCVMGLREATDQEVCDALG